MVRAASLPERFTVLTKVRSGTDGLCEDYFLFARYFSSFSKLAIYAIMRVCSDYVKERALSFPLMTDAQLNLFVDSSPASRFASIRNRQELGAALE